MKQYITKEQWDELDEKQKEKFHEKSSIGFGRMIGDGFVLDGILPNIGEMIEFLGSLFLKEFGFIISEKYSQENKNNELYLKIKYPNKEWKIECFCDALWESVKRKLK